MSETLLSVTEAQAKILTLLQPTTIEQVPIEKFAGRVLAEEITAPGDLPAFDNSSMDGYAVRSADSISARPDKPVLLRIVADIAAGSTPGAPIRAGQAARIMTGAPVPEGADAVAPVEDTNFAPGLPQPTALDAVLLYKGAAPGAYIRRRGEDVAQGQLLLRPGRRLLPQDVGMLAAVGRTSAAVYRRPRVAVFSSGDELVQPGSTPAPGQIFDANQYSLAALIEQAGAEVLRAVPARDDPQQIRTALAAAVQQGADLIVSSAGVSVGAYDYVRGVIEAEGSLSFWKVNMRPGKPLAVGLFHGVPLIGLPGNPVSALVGGHVFVVPALRRLSGQAQTTPLRLLAELDEALESDGRESYLRAVVRREDNHLRVRLTGHQGSGNLFSFVQANALLIVPSGVKSLPAKSLVEIWYLGPE